MNASIKVDIEVIGEIKEGSVLLIRDTEYSEVLAERMTEISSRLPEGALVIFSDEKVELLSEKEMNEAGWFKKKEEPTDLCPCGCGKEDKQ